MERQKGKFIVFEGGEGSGKDANIAYVKEMLGEKDILYTREPGGTKVGEEIRSIALNPAHTPATATELLLFLAARAQLVQEVIKPSLERGTHVISNRFGLSTVAYQIYRTGHFEYQSFLETATRFVCEDITPYYIFLDVPPEVGLARVQSRGEALTRFDAESLAVHEKVREGFLKEVVKYDHTIIDATPPFEEVRKQMLAVVKKVLKLG